MEGADAPFVRRPIDHTGWFLVFTRRGRYFFYDSVDECSRWRPPEHLLEYLLDLPADRLALLFNPYEECPVDEPQYAQDHVMEEEEEEPDYVVETESEHEGELVVEREGDYKGELVVETESSHEEADPLASNEGSSSVVAERMSAAGTKRDPEEHQLAVENFRQLLLDREDLDPFQAWERLSSSLAADSRFQAIRSERERRTIFESICPQLAERARKKREAQHLQATEAWKGILERLTLAHAPATWTEFSRHVKKEPWFRLLNPKTLEREYRTRLAELRTRSAVYQIPK